MADKNPNKKDEEEEVVDAEIVEEGVKESDETASTASEDNLGDTNAAIDELQNIQSLINSNMTKIDKIQEDMKPVKEMLESLLDADLEYAELDQKAMDAAKNRSAKRKELMNTSNGKELTEKLKNLKKDLKEAKVALSDYLREYQRTTGFNEYEGPDGELRQIVFTAKLVRKTKLNWDK